MPWVYIWLGVTVAALVVEFVTLDMVSIWFSAGGLVAMILALLDVSYEIQIVVAVVVSLICVLSLRKISLKWLNRTNEKTNLDLIIGKKFKLLTKITQDEVGTVKINGIVYSAKSVDNKEIEENEYVKILKIEGNKLIVEKENK